MIRVKLDTNEASEITKARRWCIENFGSIPLKGIYEFDKKEQQRISYIFSGTKVYDESQARWINRLSKAEIFYFRYEEDAVAFKLRWL